MKRRYISYVHVYYNVVKHNKTGDRVTNNSLFKTTVVGENEEEARSLPTFDRLMKNLQQEVSANSSEAVITKIEFIERLSKTMYEV